MTRDRPFSLSSPLGLTSAAFLESVYEQYRQDPLSVDISWRYVFQLAQELGGDDDALRAEFVRRHGHLSADIDPLEQAPKQNARKAGSPHGGHGHVSADIERLHRRYQGHLAVETGHLDSPELIKWVNAAFEASEAVLDSATLRRAHQRLVEAEEFEHFLAKRFPGKKKFGIEGAEVLVVALDRLLTQAIALGIDEVVIGTMHRGRLNILANVLGKPLDALFSEFKGAHPFANPGSSCADVPYHLGYQGVFCAGGGEVRVTLLPNPSHLEAVDAVALGRVRALQDSRSAATRRNVLGLIIHTDAAVIGQGVVSETIQLAGLREFSTCGTVHLVVNNQIGFTTDPGDARTSRYCTGAWKAVDSLILHVNGDRPQAAIRAVDMAMSFRHSHGKDAVIDLLTYRRNGHNEFDEPRFTHPVLYQRIDAKTSVRALFEAELLSTKILTDKDGQVAVTSYRQRLERGFGGAAAYQPPSDYLDDARASFVDDSTGVDASRLKRLLETLAHIPSGMMVSDKLHRLVQQRAQIDRGIQWAVAEALAFGSLLLEGVPVRISGQDIVRGAFSHRHFALTDTHTGERHISLSALDPTQATFTAVNSPLSEYGVLGFEYGYSLSRAQGLTIWEAQFGDFANGAQIVIDQFVSSGEEKWRQSSGLVVLLPHGLEGQGPEHSSARIERYLQMAAGENILIVNPSTPANYFHILRQQVLGRTRKPLIVIAPKTLLRLPAAVSCLADFESGTAFQPVIVTHAQASPRKILLCSGKIAYELEEYRQQVNAMDVTIVRLERLYPMPSEALVEVLSTGPEAKLVWVQEEPENMGAWNWYDRKLEALATAMGHGSPRFEYCGRHVSASPAGGFHSNHGADQAALVMDAFA
ncbi:2-oxoglutarate dehydrogenase E1 component [Alcaligenaceae bacterium CGII-47]|nr:2-oxoglutarate dehydrogenase E1 component [Alcaligenaceae bacterium CGII-47]